MEGPVFIHFIRKGEIVISETAVIIKCKIQVQKQIKKQFQTSDFASG